MFPVLICSTLVWRVAIAKKTSLLIQQESLSVNSTLKILLNNLQQHRGMLNATLSGDDSFTEKIKQTQQLINSTLSALEKTLNQTVLSSNLVQLNSIQKSWKNLYPTVLSLSKQESLKKHTVIVQSTLFLMANIAEENNLLKNNCYPVVLVDIIWHRIPNAAEVLGKMRAAGSGIAATGTCGAIEQIKVAFLIKHINDTIAIVENGLNKLQNDSSDSHKLSSTYKLIQSDIRELVDTLKYKILEPDTPQVTAAAFFERATVCLGKVYGFFDQAETIINQKITSTIVRTESNIKISFFMMILSFSIMLISLTIV